MIALLVPLVVVGCGQKVARKADVDAYINANIHTAADVEAHLDLAKQMGKDRESLANEAIAADTTADDVVGGLEAKGISRDEIDKIKRANQSGLPRTGSVSSSLNWDPNSADAVPAIGIDPDRILPIGPQQFAEVVKNLALAERDLRALVATAPHEWSATEGESKCQGARRRRNVCIMQRAHYKEYWTNAVTGCAEDEIILVNSPAQIRQALEKLDRACVEVGSLRLMSHGRPGRMAMGLSVSNVDAVFLGVGGLFGEGAKVDVHGCSVGKSCLGSVFMLKVARKIFARSSGLLRAPVVTTYFLPAENWESFETDAKKAVLYTPAKLRGAWTESGAGEAPIPSSLASSCGNEFESIVARIKHHKRNAAQLGRCSIAKYASSDQTLDSVLASATELLSLPESKLDNLRLRALANLSDLLTHEVNEMDLNCR